MNQNKLNPYVSMLFPDFLYPKNQLKCTQKVGRFITMQILLIYIESDLIRPT